jgi:tetratricopeptide (TPR) repeat protein
LTSWSAFNTQQWEKAAKYGEKTYALKPDTPQLPSMLARAYLNSGHMDKSLPFAEQTCADAPPKDCYDLLPSIMRHYAAQKNWPNAAKWAAKMVEAFDTVAKPAGVSDEQWTGYVTEEKSTGYALMGRQAAETKRWSSVIKNYATSHKLNPKNRARTAEGYFYTGMAHWNMENIDSAMASFARASLLAGTPHSEPARKEVERLYKATHNGSLAGFEEYLDRYSPN